MGKLRLGEFVTCPKSILQIEKKYIFFTLRPIVQY